MKSSKENEYPRNCSSQKENNARQLEIEKRSQQGKLMPHQTKFAEFAKKCNQKDTSNNNNNAAGNDISVSLSGILGRYSNNCNQYLSFEDFIPLSNKCFVDEPTHALESANSAEKINPLKISNSSSCKQRIVIKNKDIKSQQNNTKVSFTGNLQSDFDAETTSSFNLSQMKSREQLKDITDTAQLQNQFSAQFGCIGQDLRKVSESVPIILEESAEETVTVRSPKRFQSLIASNHNLNKKAHILVSDYISPQCSKDVITDYFKRSNAAEVHSEMPNFDEYLNSFKLKYKKKFRCKKKYNNYLKEKDTNFQEFVETNKSCCKEQGFERKSNAKHKLQLNESSLGRMSSSRQSNSSKVDKELQQGNITNLAKILAESSWNFQMSSELKQKSDCQISSPVKNVRSKSATGTCGKNDEKLNSSSDNFSRRIHRIFRNNPQKSGLLNESMKVHHSQDIQDESSQTQCLSATAPRHTLRRCFPLENSQEMIISPNTLTQTAAQMKTKIEKDKISATQQQQIHMRQLRASSAGLITRKHTPNLFSDQQFAQSAKVNQTIRESGSITEIPGISSSTAATSAGSTRKVSMCKVDLNKMKCEIFHESDHIIDQIQINSQTPQSIRQAFSKKQQRKLKPRKNATNASKESLKEFTFSATKNAVQNRDLLQNLDQFQSNFSTKHHSKSPIAQRRSFSQAIKKETSIIASLNENSLKILTPSSISRGFQKQSAIEQEYLQFLAACPLSTTTARKRRSTSQGRSRPTTSGGSFKPCYGIN